MNKKKLIVIIVIIVLVLIGCLIGSYFLFFHTEDVRNSSGGKSSSDNVVTIDSWLRASSVSELENLAEKSDKTIELGLEDAYVADLPFGEGVATYCYHINSEEKLVGLNIGQIIVPSTESGESFVMEDVTAQQLCERIGVVLEWVSEVLNVTIGSNFYIFSANGEMLPVDEYLSYQQILDGTASLDLRILDVDDSVWILEIGMVQGYNIVTCTFEHCMADSEDAKLPCYVAVE